jgi:hypothetical protein
MDTKVALERARLDDLLYLWRRLYAERIMLQAKQEVVLVHELNKVMEAIQDERYLGLKDLDEEYPDKAYEEE